MIEFHPRQTWFIRLTVKGCLHILLDSVGRVLYVVIKSIIILNAKSIILTTIHHDFDNKSLPVHCPIVQTASHPQPGEIPV